MELEGTYIEACNCEAACPCIFFSPPTEGERKVVVGWHVDKGRRGDTALDGLNAALIVYAPGNMKDGQWKVASIWTSVAMTSNELPYRGSSRRRWRTHRQSGTACIAQVLGARPAWITFDKGANARVSLRGRRRGLNRDGTDFKAKVRERGDQGTSASDDIRYLGREREREAACKEKWLRGSCLLQTALGSVAGYGIGSHTFVVLPWGLCSGWPARRSSGEPSRRRSTMEAIRCLRQFGAAVTRDPDQQGTHRVLQ